MNKQTRETAQTAGIAFSFAYALIPQVRKFVNEQTNSLFGTSSESGESTGDSTSDNTDSTDGA